MSKKIIPLVSLIIIAILVIATIVMACIPKSYAPTNVAPVSIVLGNDDSYYAKGDVNTKKVYNELYSAYQNSFTESSINALFNGRLALNAEVNYTETAISINNLGTNHIMLNFGSMQKVEIEGTEYQYNKMVIELDSTNVMKTVKAYLFNSDTYYTGTNYYISTIGNLEGLVNYVNELG